MSKKKDCEAYKIAEHLPHEVDENREILPLFDVLVEEALFVLVFECPQDVLLNVLLQLLFEIFVEIFSLVEFIADL